MKKSTDIFNIQYAQFLLEIMDSGAVAKSGDKFDLTPCASTRLLDKLRRGLGDPLFTQGKTGLIPTLFCQSLRPKLVSFIELLGSTQEMPFSPVSCRDNFRFFSTLSVTSEALSYILPRLQQQAPEARVEQIDVRDDPFATLMQRDVDVLLITKTDLPAQAHYKNLYPLNRCVLLRQGHPLLSICRAEVPTIDQLLQYKRVSLHTGRRQGWNSPDHDILMGERAQRQVVFRTGRFQSAWGAIAASDMIAICGYRGALAAMQSYPLTTLPLPASLNTVNPWNVLVWSDATHRDPAQQWFRSLWFDWAARIL